jgi:hypothetical protein
MQQQSKELIPVRLLVNSTQHTTRKNKKCQIQLLQNCQLAV